MKLPLRRTLVKLSTSQQSQKVGKSERQSVNNNHLSDYRSCRLPD